MYLKLNESDTEPTGKNNDFKKFPQEEINLETESLLQDVPMHFWAIFQYKYWQN